MCLEFWQELIWFVQTTNGLQKKFNVDSNYIAITEIDNQLRLKIDNSVVCLDTSILMTSFMERSS
jgi:hypothetical protein